MPSPQAIRRGADRHLPDCVKFARELIALPSPSGKEEKVIARVSEEMKRLGYDEVRTDRLGSVIGRIGSGPVNVLFDSHVDTVGVGDPESWSFDPLKGKVERGKIFGRGAADNKGGLASMVYAGRLYKEVAAESAATVWVVGSVLKEECDGLAYRALFEMERLVPDFVVLGDSSGLGIHRGHRGRLEIRVTTKGRSCLASDPGRGVNALYRMVPLIQRVEALNSHLKSHPFLGPGTVAVTGIDCRTPSLNAVPDSCSIYLDRRLTWGESKKPALDEIKRLVRGPSTKVEVLRYQSASYTGLVLPMEKYYPSWMLDEKHLLVQSAAETYEQLFGKPPVIDRWKCSSHGVYTMGVAKVPTIGFGPSEERFAHSTEDQVPIEHLKKAMMFYTALPGQLLRRLGRTTLARPA
jgi:putative selenium metabolism hydrolase